jgi:hypothetical protein
MRVPMDRRPMRTWAVALVAVAAAALAACTPAPESSVSDLFEGGTYPVEVVIEPQTVTTEFSLLGLVDCTSTSVTPSVDLRGTLTVAPAELDPGLTRATIPGASLELPASTVSAGSLSLSCNGTHLATIGVALQFDGAAAVQTAVLDVPTGTLSLMDPTLTLTNVRATFAGAPAGAAPTPLDPITVTIPTIDVAV